MRALLFDLDGTLTRSSGAGTRALAAAVGARVRAAQELRKMRLDGMTDRAIARLLLAAERHGQPQEVPDEDIDAVLSQYLLALEKECAAKAYVALPGVPQLLDRLARRDGLLLGLCTGNLEPGARLKLGCVGLWDRFRFGGYGSDAEPRPDIVRTAWKRARELGATEALVAVYGDRVYRLAIGITGNHSDAEEVVQDALWTVVRKIDTFRGESAFGSWLYRIVANAAYQKLRHRPGRRGEISLDEVLPPFHESGQHVTPSADWSPSVDDPSRQAELRMALTASIEELPPDYRAVVLLHDVEGLSNVEVAESLGITVANAKSRTHRARLFLRSRLAVYVGSEEAMPGAVGGSTSGAI